MVSRLMRRSKKRIMNRGNFGLKEQGNQVKDCRILDRLISSDTSNKDQHFSTAFLRRVLPWLSFYAENILIACSSMRTSSFKCLSGGAKVWFRITQEEMKDRTRI